MGMYATKFLLSTDPVQLACQLTLADFALLRVISERDFICWTPGSRDAQCNSAKNGLSTIKAFLLHEQNLLRWVSSVVTKTSSTEEYERIMNRLIEVTEVHSLR